ncbi:hypothetical protein [Bartonella henselae]|uniref:hypothetical protein n=1 Tax=Bartonella henselae TaxID=38323 RepID=UPI001F277B48|nr:hypothetical protein [Bartonella henselae]UJM37326.1 hypothetical protein KAE71_00120 [Bartonella henselae]
MRKTSLKMFWITQKRQDSAEGQTKAAISNGTIILTDEVGQKALTGQDVEQTIASLNRDTATAHHAVSKIDIEKLERIVHENREMATQLLEEGFSIVMKPIKLCLSKNIPSLWWSVMKRAILFISKMKMEIL